MLLLPEQKALVYRLRNPSKILDAIPTSRLLELNGENLVAVPHRQDETKVLRNLGLKAPAPVLSYYDWPGRWTALDHQKLTAAFASMNQRAFILNDMGTMKTASVIWAALWLRRMKKIRRVLVLAPLSTLEFTWADELFRIDPSLDVAVLHAASAKRRRMAAEPHDFYILNHDGYEIVADDLNPEIDLVIVDEATVYKNAQSQRWKSIKGLLHRPNLWVWMMTGTPMADSPLAAWAMAKLMYPNLQPRYFGAWRSHVMHQLAERKWVPQPDAARKVLELLQPAIRFSRESCVQIPDTLVVPHKTALTKVQKSAYDSLQNQLAAEVESGVIVAANEGVKVMKLVQVACGVVYGEEGAVHVLGAEPRIEALKEIIREAASKVIVFVPLTGALNYVKSHLEKEWDCAVVDGSVSKNQRDEIFRGFQNGEKPHVLIAHPETMSHGLTLTAADTIVWYAPIHSNEIYSQANARITRPGQTRKTLIAHLFGTEIEAQMYRRLQQKQTMQGVLLDFFKRSAA